MLALGSGLLLAPAAPAASAGAARVQMEDGLVSATFDATPAAEALEAIRRGTGARLVLPQKPGERTVTLTRRRVALHELLHAVLAALDFGGFALVYEHDGTAARLAIVDRGRKEGAPVAPSLGIPLTGPVTAMNPMASGTRVTLVMQRPGHGLIPGAPGQVLVAHSPPLGTARTSACDGKSAEHPVQMALLAQGEATFVVETIVCGATGLPPGQPFVPGPPDGEGRSPTERGRTRFTATAP